MNFNGIIVGAAVFLSIGICHPAVIKMEYYLGKQSWWIWLVALTSEVLILQPVPSLPQDRTLGARFQSGIQDSRYALGDTPFILEKNLLKEGVSEKWRRSLI